MTFTVSKDVSLHNTQADGDIDYGLETYWFYPVGLGLWYMLILLIINLKRLGRRKYKNWGLPVIDK